MFKNFQKRNTRQDILNDTLPTGVMHGQDQGKSNTPNHQHHTSHKGTSSHALTLKPKDENMSTSIYNMERRLQMRRFSYLSFNKKYISLKYNCRKSTIVLKK